MDHVQTAIEFHQAIVTASHNPVLIELYSGLVGVLATSIRDVVADPAMPSMSPDAHAAVYQAIRAGDADTAALETARHLDGLIESIESRA